MSVKAFEILPCVDNLMPTIISAGRKKRLETEITCLDFCNDNLYIGTDDSFIHHYYNSDSRYDNIRHSSTPVTKRSITQLKVLSAIDRLLVLSDACLFVYYLSELKPTSINRIKGIASFCLNEKSDYDNPFGVEIGVAMKKKSIHIYHITESKITLVREICTTEPPLNILLVGSYFCISLATRYKIGDISPQGSVSELFPYSDGLKPVVACLEQNEFLVNAPGCLGMFTSVTGTSPRPPLQWSQPCVDIVFSHPYVLVMHPQSVSIHNICDQMEKQSLPFPDGTALYICDGIVFACTSHSVHLLHCLPIEYQIEDLLTHGNLNEALSLAKNVRNTSLSKDQLYSLIKDIQLKFGFVKFAKMEFKEAHTLFDDGFLDIRELLILYDGCVDTTSTTTTSSAFTSKLSDIRDFTSVQQLTSGATSLADYHDFLRVRLERIVDDTEFKRDVHTGLLYIYSYSDSSSLIEFVSNASRQFSAELAVKLLTDYNRRMALACLHRCHGDYHRAITVWEQMFDDKESFDANFPGLSIIMTTISSIEDHSTALEHIVWLSRNDKEKTQKVLIQRLNKIENRKTFDLYLDAFIEEKSDCLLFLLEYLVKTRKFKVAKHHKLLADMYAETALREHTLETRERLQLFLQGSGLYDVQSLLQRLRNTELYEEIAILYGKLGEHEKALDILTEKLSDLRQAELYCIRCHDNQQRRYLFSHLLNIVLKRKGDTQGSVISLLKRNYCYYDLEKVIDLLPSDWSIQVLSPFLVSSFRHTLSEQRWRAMEHSLTRCALNNTMLQHSSLSKEFIKLDEQCICDICGKEFSDGSFTLLKSKWIVHNHCIPSEQSAPPQQ